MSQKTKARDEFLFVDLFAGLGGFHLAASALGGKCMFASEIDEQLRKIYVDNFDFRPDGDIRAVDVQAIPDHDLLCAGFPCQPFSKAGEQMGWKDPVRGTVFWNIIQILKAKKPPLVLLENVAHFVRHDSGNTYEKVKIALEGEGYRVETRQFSPHQFGIPQIRERAYMVGIQGRSAKFEWPTPETPAKPISLKLVLDQNPKDAIGISPRVEACLNVWQDFLDLFNDNDKLPSFPIWSMEFGATYPYECDALCQVPPRILRGSRGSFGVSLENLDDDEFEANLPSHARGLCGVFPKWKKDFIRQNREFYLSHQSKLNLWIKKIREFPSSLQKLEWNCQGEERRIWNYVIQFRASGVRVKRATTSPSLVAMTSSQIPIIGWEKRYMTHKERARLQSMDKLKRLPEGDRATRALGNAVNVKVVQKIMKNLLLALPVYQK